MKFPFKLVVIEHYKYMDYGILRGHSRVFKTGQAKVHPVNHLIKCVVFDNFTTAHMAFLLLVVYF